ncbi:VOC family protein [Nocardia sp. CWNU-33]|uniref:VOC family protein n=1 Tax=Nocardia sp. CWNU-33 TaxID=3392117 RepID=UPI00398EB6AD
MRISPIAGLGYLVVQTGNIEQWRDYATTTLGMMPSKLALPDDGSCAFRMDDRMARIIVVPGAEQVAAVGWEIASSQEWDELSVRLDHAGVTGVEIAGEQAQRRGVSQLMRVEDPSGEVVEFGLRPLCDAIDRFVSPNGVRFVTGDQGMGHTTRAVANYAETVDFYTRVLGFRIRETIDGAIRATFLGVNPRQHSLALLDGHGENHFDHLMVEVDSIDDVGRCYDRVEAGRAAGIRLTHTLGRHFNDRMTSFYMKSPSDFQVEFGFGGLRVDDTWIENAQGGVGGPSLWGHRRLGKS